jgi:hypothetical protein
MEAKALSLAIASICTDGLVLSAERELGTQFVKHYERKLSSFPLAAGRGWVVLGYAGSPDTMKTIQEKLRNKLEGQDKTRQEIWEDLEGVLDETLPEHPDIDQQLLCGFSESRKLHLLKSYNRTVSPVPVWDCVGFGDCALTRYLGGIFLEDRIHLPLYRAVPICVYMVAQAKKYVPGCGGQTDLIVMTRQGEILWHSVPAHVETACNAVEHSINAVLTSATEPNTDIQSIQSLVEVLHNVLDSQTKLFMPLLPPGYVLPKFFGL